MALVREICRHGAARQPYRHVHHLGPGKGAQQPTYIFVGLVIGQGRRKTAGRQAKPKRGIRRTTLAGSAIVPETLRIIHRPEDI
jgi:hypothetical protein